MGLRREQFERINVARAQHPKVTAVYRGELRLIQPFNNSQYGCIDESDARVGVLVAKLAHTSIVFRQERLNNEDARRNVIEQRDHDRRIESPLNPIVYLDQHRRRNDKRLPGRENQLPGCHMIGVIPIKRAIQRPSVKN